MKNKMSRQRSEKGWCFEAVQYEPILLKKLIRGRNAIGVSLESEVSRSVDILL